MKKKIGAWTKGWFFILGMMFALLAATPFFVKLANVGRIARGGSAGVGGEAFIWLFPMILYMPHYFLHNSSEYAD